MIRQNKNGYYFCFPRSSYWTCSGWFALLTKPAKTISVFIFASLLIFSSFSPKALAVLSGPLPSSSASDVGVFGAATSGNEVPVSNTALDALARKEVGVIQKGPIKIGGLGIPTTINKSLDSFYWDVANLVIHTMTQEVVRWIQTGRNGKPLFVTNWKDFLKKVGDEAGGRFIDEIGLDGLCQPFAPRIELLLRAGGDFKTRAQCTITKVVSNIENFYADFRNGGWDAWFNITLVPQNNLYGAYYLSLEEKLKRESEAIYGAQNEALASGGVLGVRQCDEDINGNIIESSCSIKTPGHVVASQLEKVLNLPTDRLAVADEVDEILGAALKQLLSTLRTHSKGLLIPNKGSAVENGLDDLNDAKNQEYDALKNAAATSNGGAAQIASMNSVINIKNDSVDKLKSEIKTLNSLKDCTTAKTATSTEEIVNRTNSASNTLLSVQRNIQDLHAMQQELLAQYRDLVNSKGVDLFSQTFDAWEASQNTVTATDFANAQSENDQITADKSQVESDLTACKK